MKIYLAQRLDEVYNEGANGYVLGAFIDKEKAEECIIKDLKNTKKSFEEYGEQYSVINLFNGFSIYCDNGNHFLLTIEEIELQGSLYAVTELNDLECEYPYASCRDICNNMEDAIKHRNQLKLRAKNDLRDIVDEDENYLYDGRNSIFYNISEINL